RQDAQAAHREVDVQRRTALQKAASSWQQMVSFKQSISSDRMAISANVIALDGVERQALVGTSTTLAVLQQQQTLLQSQRTLVQHLSNLVTSSYAVAAAIGRLTAVDLKLGVPLYDEKAYYNAVKNRLWGLSDYAINQPGR
ncbi:MAG: TolC family protein, partial [Gluconobacter oxydans]